MHFSLNNIKILTIPFCIQNLFCTLQKINALHASQTNSKNLKLKSYTSREACTKIPVKIKVRNSRRAFSSADKESNVFHEAFLCFVCARMLAYRFSIKSINNQCKARCVYIHFILNTASGGRGKGKKARAKRHQLYIELP
jgi:hypothetical protein